MTTKSHLVPFWFDRCDRCDICKSTSTLLKVGGVLTDVHKDLPS